MRDFKTMTISPDEAIDLSEAEAAA